MIYPINLIITRQIKINSYLPLHFPESRGVVGGRYDRRGPNTGSITGIKNHWME
jgi:hypothetical protein